jgi:hypothetical protein
MPHTMRPAGNQPLLSRIRDIFVPRDCARMKFFPRGALIVLGFAASPIVGLLVLCYLTRRSRAAQNLPCRGSRLLTMQEAHDVLQEK